MPGDEAQLLLDAAHVVGAVPLVARLLEPAQVDLVAPPTAQHLGHRHRDPGARSGGVEDPQARLQRRLDRRGEGGDGVRQRHHGDAAQGPLPQRSGLHQRAWRVVRAHRRQPQVDDVQLRILALHVASQLLHQILGNAVAVAVQTGMLVGNRQLQGTERLGLKAHRGNRAGSDDLAAAALAQVVQQRAGADGVHHDRGVLRGTAGHRPQVHGAVEAMLIQPQEVLVLLEVAAHDRHPQLRAPARQRHHLVPLCQFTHQRASNEPARPGNQDLHVDDSTRSAQDCNRHSSNRVHCLRSSGVPCRGAEESMCRIAGVGSGPRQVLVDVEAVALT